MMKTAFSRWILATVAWMCALPATSAAAEVIELKLAHFMPVMHVQHREAFVPFADKVAELTGGRVRVKIFPGGTLGNPKTMVDAI
ncbi:MAG TPA: hypothetical protein VLT88_10400, partial [Desulfosarcina sp.]|nr:hypothetical protein [Desulfosarcina sp.]